jgi:hypothetical protein
LFFFEIPSTAQDRFYLGLGTPSDTQGDLLPNLPSLVGTGSLSTAVTAGDTQVSLLMESDDFEFIAGGYLHISDKFMINQTIDTGVTVGSSVEFNTTLSKWVKAPQTDNIAYPNGILVGLNKVMTEQGSTNEEWLRIAENLHTSEDIGDGDGSTTFPALTSLTNHINGICRQQGLTPVVTAICGGVVRTVNVDAYGVCTGYCSTGQLDMTTGAWPTAITWTTAPDAGTDITITYRENPFSYAGNTVTVSLADQVAYDYAIDNTYAGGCLTGGDVIGSFSDWTETSTSGTYDEATYPVLLNNQGAVEDIWTITIGTGGAFTCAGASEGAVSSGTVGTDFSPINPDTGTAYFTLLGAGWNGTWDSSDTIVFTTHPAQRGLWIKEVVPAGTPADSYNLFVLGFYSE